MKGGEKMKISIDFSSLWCVMTFITFLVRYFPERPIMDIEFIVKTFGWGLLWTVVVIFSNIDSV